MIDLVVGRVFRVIDLNCVSRTVLVNCIYSATLNGASFSCDLMVLLLHLEVE